MKSEIKAIVVDDEPHSRDILEHLLRLDGAITVVAKCQNISEALAAAITLKPDIVFLDIEMPGGSGFDFLEQLRHFDVAPEIVFVTAYNQYAIKAIKHSAFDYLLKPVDLEDLNFTIKRFRETATRRNLDERADNLFRQIQEIGKVKFSTRNGIIFLNPDDISWCQASGSYTIIHLHNRKDEIVSIPLREVEDSLKGFPFFRASRSALINLKYLVRIDKRNKNCIIQIDEMVIEVPVSPTQLKNLESA